MDWFLNDNGLCLEWAKWTRDKEKQANIKTDKTTTMP